MKNKVDLMEFSPYKRRLEHFIKITEEGQEIFEKNIRNILKINLDNKLNIHELDNYIIHKADKIYVDKIMQMISSDKLNDEC